VFSGQFQTGTDKTAIKSGKSLEKISPPVYFSKCDKGRISGFSGVCCNGVWNRKYLPDFFYNNTEQDIYEK
jgi:hypothetical protein